MRYLFFVVLLCCWMTKSYAQEEIDTTIKLDLLKAPTSPALNMLGIAPSLIERPTDLTALLISVQQSSGNFTSFPSNYAIEIAPFLLFNKRGHPLNTFDSTRFKYVLPQSFQLSIGVSRQNKDGKVTNDSTGFTRLGLGVKFSIVRPRWSAATRENFTKLLSAQKELLAEYETNTTSDRIKELEEEAQQIGDSMMIVNLTIQPAADDVAMQNKKRELLRGLVARRARINNELNNARSELVGKTDAYKKTKKIASEFKVERMKGGYLDFASGMVIDFPGDRFTSSLTSKAGAWLTGGYASGNEGLSLMGIVRYLYQPKKLFADNTGLLNTEDISTLDMGTKIALAAAKGRFNLSGEAIYRSVLQKDIIDPTWRIVFNLEYDIGLNQKLTFGIGKNFDGTITEDGNLIAMLNLVKGFGSSRKIQQ